MGRKFNPQSWRRLVAPERREVNDPEQILTALQVEPGQKLLDVGCGPGWFTLPAADLLGLGGTVYALDVSPEMLAVLRQRLDDTDLTVAAPVATVLVEEGRPWPLEAAGCHRILIANVFHEVERVEPFLAEVKRVLHPEGLVLVVDWQAEEMPMGPPLHHRLPATAVVAAFTTAGFRLHSEPPVGPYHYGLLFAAG